MAGDGRLGCRHLTDLRARFLNRRVVVWPQSEALQLADADEKPERKLSIALLQVGAGHLARRRTPSMRARLLWLATLHCSFVAVGLARRCAP